MSTEKNKIWIWKAYDLLAKRIIARKIGKRNHRTLKEFLKEIGIKGRDFVTGNYDGFHITGKDLTFPIAGQQFDEALSVEI